MLKRLMFMYSCQWNSISQLWGVTCHMGSRSDYLPPDTSEHTAEAGTRFTYSRGMEG